MKSFVFSAEFPKEIVVRVNESYRGQASNVNDLVHLLKGCEYDPLKDRVWKGHSIYCPQEKSLFKENEAKQLLDKALEKINESYIAFDPEVKV